MNSWLEFGKQIWKHMPKDGKRIVIVLFCYALGSQAPWGIFGDLGSNISTILILGSIFLVIKMVSGDVEEKKTEKKRL